MSEQLTEKQKRFVDEYLRLLNGTKAYQSAYAHDDYTPDENTASSQAYRLLRNHKVIKAIEEKREELQKLNPVCTIEELSEGWSNDIRFDISELVDEEGRVKHPKQLSRKARRLLQGFKVKQSVIKVGGDGEDTIIDQWFEYKLPDRQKARIELGKRLGFYPAEEVKHTGNVTLSIEGLED